MSNCRDCGREEWGFLSALDDDGYCYSCAAKHNKEKIARLQEQLNEANEVIKKYATGTTQIKAKKYEGSCYITDPFTGERERIEDWGEEYDADIPMSNDDKPAKEYLEKWGVK